MYPCLRIQSDLIIEIGPRWVSYCVRVTINNARVTIRISVSPSIGHIFLIEHIIYLQFDQRLFQAFVGYFVS